MTKEMNKILVRAKEKILLHVYYVTTHATNYSPPNKTDTHGSKRHLMSQTRCKANYYPGASILI